MDASVLQQLLEPPPAADSGRRGSTQRAALLLAVAPALVARNISTSGSAPLPWQNGQKPIKGLRHTAPEQMHAPYAILLEAGGVAHGAVAALSHVLAANHVYAEGYEPYAVKPALGWCTLHCRGDQHSGFRRCSAMLCRGEFPASISNRLKTWHHLVS
jgi:hypothetical protein